MTKKEFNLDDGSPRNETMKRFLSQAIKEFLEMNNTDDQNIIGIPEIYFTGPNKVLTVYIPGNGIPGKEVPGKQAKCLDLTKEYLDSLSKHGD